MNKLAEIVCQYQHYMEWLAPKPRTAPCIDCSNLAAFVVLCTGVSDA